MLGLSRRLIKIVRAQFAWQAHAAWNNKSLGFCSKAEQLADERLDLKIHLNTIFQSSGCMASLCSFHPQRLEPAVAQINSYLMNNETQTSADDSLNRNIQSLHCMASSCSYDLHNIEFW